MDRHRPGYYAEYNRRRTPEERAAHRAAHRAKKRAFIYEAKNRPCADCKVSYPPYVMDFDHVRGEKEFGIGDNIINVSWERLIAEVAKCDVVCANCHRIRTWTPVEVPLF